MTDEQFKILWNVVIIKDKEFLNSADNFRSLTGEEIVDKWFEYHGKEVIKNDTRRTAYNSKCN